MKNRDLIEYCVEIDCDCRECKHNEICDKFFDDNGHIIPYIFFADIDDTEKENKSWLESEVIV